MQRFKNILVVVGEGVENRAVVERAVTLAQRNRARLTVVNTIKALPPHTLGPIGPEERVDAQEPAIDIIEEWPPDVGLLTTPEPPESIQQPPGEEPGEAAVKGIQAAVVIREHIVEEESQRLEKWVDFVRESGVAVTGKMLVGTPFLEIIREVLRNEHDLVMTTATDHRGLRERLFGSSAMHLLRKCPCPVWVVRPTQPREWTRILAAVDPTPLPDEQSGVSIKIMDLATALAQRQHSELVVAHTWTFSAEDSLRSGYLVASRELDELVREAQGWHRRKLSELLRRYPLQDLKLQVYLLKGEPGQLIPELAAKLEVGLIVMGTVRRSGIAGLFIGDTAERILRRVDCSILAVKPDGFVTPVSLDD